MAVILADGKGNSSGRGRGSVQGEPRAFGDLARAPDVEQGQVPLWKTGLLRCGPSETDGTTSLQFQR